MQTQMIKVDPRANEPRMLVEVTIRPGHMGQALPDGVIYPSGVHEVRIYAADYPRLVALLETQEDAHRAAVDRHARMMAEWVGAAKGRLPEQYPGSVSQWFRDDMRRELLPITSLRPIGSLDSTTMEAKRADAEAAATAAVGARGITPDVAAIVREEVAKALAAERAARKDGNK